MASRGEMPSFQSVGVLLPDWTSIISNARLIGLCELPACDKRWTGIDLLFIRNDTIRINVEGDHERNIGCS